MFKPIVLLFNLGIFLALQSCTNSTPTISDFSISLESSEFGESSEEADKAMEERIQKLTKATAKLRENQAFQTAEIFTGGSSTTEGEFTSILYVTLQYKDSPSFKDEELKKIGKEQVQTVMQTAAFEEGYTRYDLYQVEFLPHEGAEEKNGSLYKSFQYTRLDLESSIPSLE